uniref:NADH dehydrogenase subunit 5 n=1 Tax=Haslea pseudostrearia TaxID=197756 RepID=UPI0021FA7EF1|nr:NADH dehydrogenase subunit 5 [Haslea pseudostrearia]UXN44214.1 NADH dehydrogenase subunit 5 [Haslea pseudostrearia]
MYTLLPFMPLISSFSAGFLGSLVGFNGAPLLATGCLFISFLISLFIFYEVALVGCFSYVKIALWINSEVFLIDWSFMYDSLTAVMCCVVTFISCLVHLYSTDYMSHDPHLPRFMSYLSLFTFFMLILVTAENYVQMFIGWEGVGLCSYLLINFWFTRIQANKAAIKAMLINRIGDFSLILGILILFAYFKTVDYASVAVLVPYLKDTTINFLNMDFNLLTIVGILFFIGAVGKSAQIGLHTWLPDAMEGPTPVSALIHAATMVTAGVFLIARSSFIYEYTPNLLGYIAFLGAFTAFCASTIGLLQNDLKRVIAYSTCSQLGYMVFICGLSNYSAGIFHLANHAFFKALLFLSAGSIIHAINDEQDMRKMGGLKNLLPFTYSMVIIGSLALIGFPFLAGFYSKDLILELAYSKYSWAGYFSYFLGSFGAFFTAFYSMRLLCLTFLCRPFGHRSVIGFAYDAEGIIAFVLGILAIPSIFIGFYGKDLIVGLGSDFFKTAIHVSSGHINVFESEFVSLIYKILPVCLSLFGSFLAFFLYNFQVKFLYYLKISFVGKIIYNFFNRKWFFDKVYNECIGQFFFKFGYNTSYKFMDRGIFEILGPTGLSIFLTQVASDLYKLQTGYLYHYTYSILLAFTFLFGLKEVFTLFGNSLDFRIFVLAFIVTFFLNRMNIES